MPEWVSAEELDPVVVRGIAGAVPVVALSPDRTELRRRARGRSANALLAVVEGITRPMRAWSQAN